MRILVLLLLLCTRVPAQRLPVDQVDVFSGTSNSRWMFFPGPTQPLGMVKLSPDNQLNVWNGGYEYTVGSISGFSHLHGMALAGVSYMPYVGPLDFGDEYLKLFPGSPDGPFGNMWTAGYRSRYGKASERGGPGYYAVDLIDTPVRVELTATDRCGMIRTTFPATRQARLLLDFDPPTEERSDILATSLRRVSDTEIAGSITFSNTYVDRTTVYFHSRFDAPIASIDAWQYAPYTGSTAVSYGTDWRRACSFTAAIDTFSGGSHSGVVLNFSTTAGQQIVTATGLSFVSAGNALLNLEAELGELNYDFDRTVTHAREVWNELLGAVTVKGSPENSRKFYTNLYRSFAGKNLLSDVNGQYLDMCEQVQTVRPPANAVYSSDALWGTQWDLTPLWTLVAPRYANSFANSCSSCSATAAGFPRHR